jgi:hypothetical protein
MIAMLRPGCTAPKLEAIGPYGCSDGFIEKFTVD